MRYMAGIALGLMTALWITIFAPDDTPGVVYFLNGVFTVAFTLGLVGALKSKKA